MRVLLMRAPTHREMRNWRFEAAIGWRCGDGAPSETGEVCSARRRTSRQETPSLTSAGAPMTTAVAISTACRMIP